MTKKIRQIVSSSAFYTYPSAMKGSARLVDLFGQLDSYNFKSSEKEADENALARDWTIVGHDIKKAITAYESENTRQTPEKTK